MPKPEIFTGLDIGSGQVVCVIGRKMPDQDQVDVVAAARQNCRGLKGGVVINIEETASAISRVVEATEEMSKETVRDLIVGVRGSHIQTFNHHGAINIARTDKEITPDDVAQVIESTKAVPISTDREIIHVIPQDFVLDRQQGVPNPVGMEGSLLEVEVHIVTAGTSHLNNIWRSINRAGFGIREPIYGLLAVGDVVVTQEEKDLGCLLIDLGGSTTGISIYSDGGVRFTKELPIGSEAITMDLAHGLRTSLSQAKIVKERYGTAVRPSRKQVLVTGLGQEETIDMEEEIVYTSVDGRTKKTVQRNTLFEFIAPRVEEIFTLIGRELENSGMSEHVVAGGAIITGGGVMLTGLVNAAEKILELPTRQGLPQNIMGMPEAVCHPSYASAIGLINFHTIGDWPRTHKSSRRPGGSLLARFRTIFMDLF
ncbi:MAG: cell division protein FtsA [Elusimicrobia bacterium]|nr:cell division protein FtsA [Candidatus Obscuribacterium magneticum]